LPQWRKQGKTSCQKLKGCQVLREKLALTLTKLYIGFCSYVSLPHPVDPFIERFNLTMDFAEAVRF
jgi:hypothetical protein